MEKTDIVKSQKEAQSILKFHVNGVDFNMIKVEGGTFTMGATPEQDADVWDDTPAHQVTLSDYYIGQYEVTQELWEAVMESNPSEHKGPKNPVENVSWDDVVNDFLTKLNALTGNNFTLPTEAQWEFAARGGNKSKGYKYSGSNNIDEVAWYDEEFQTGTTHPVDRKSPNELGICDMSGNIEEWCSDWFWPSYSAEALTEVQTDPLGPETTVHRVLRGGSYFNEAFFCRVSSRFYGRPSGRYGGGFRLALSNIITLNKKTLNFVKGQSEKLYVLVNGITPMISEITWSSSNPSVANVNANGKVTALSVGSTVLTARVKDIGKEFSYNVDVLDGTCITVKGVEIPLIKVDGGTFTMGATPEQEADASSDEHPAHQVTLSDYYIGQYEVTRELWKAVMGSNPSSNKTNPKKPIADVSWNVIVNDFLPRLNILTGKNFSLPTEAQWEFAARGGNKSQGYKYSGSNNIDEVAWYDANSVTRCPVGKKLPNELGLYDMSGNVCEWCNDWYGDYSAEAQTNPTGPASGSNRVSRGGYYNRNASLCRVSCRSSTPPESDYGLYGFRLVLEFTIRYMDLLS